MTIPSLFYKILLDHTPNLSDCYETFQNTQKFLKTIKIKKINKYKNYVLSISDHFIQQLFPLLRKQLTNFTNIKFRNVKKFLFGWQRNIELRFEAHPRTAPHSLHQLTFTTILRCLNLYEMGPPCGAQRGCAS